MMNEIFITNIQRYCTDDGPGIRTTVFLKGCPLRCKWCHNPETHSVKPEIMQRNDKCTRCGMCAAVCPAGARTVSGDGITVDRNKCILCGKCAEVCLNSAAELCGKAMTPAEIINEVVRDKIFYSTSGGGMTVSGGECSMFPEFTLELIRLAKERDIDVCLETSGYGDSSFFKNAVSLGVTFLYDLKELNPDKHKRLCGVDNKRILDNLDMLFDNNAKVIIRLPLIPQVNDEDEDLELLASYLKANKGKYQSFQIMPYHALGISKSKSLGKEYLSVDKDLSADECKKCIDRWNSKLNEIG